MTKDLRFDSGGLRRRALHRHRKDRTTRGIASGGSLSEAARQMRMSYRRAWLLLADLNTSFDQSVARASTGRPGGGAPCLTPFGELIDRRLPENGGRPSAACRGVL